MVRDDNDLFSVHIFFLALFNICRYRYEILNFKFSVRILNFARHAQILFSLAFLGR